MLAEVSTQVTVLKLLTQVAIVDKLAEKVNKVSTKSGSLSFVYAQLGP